MKLSEEIFIKNGYKRADTYMFPFDCCPLYELYVGDVNTVAAIHVDEDNWLVFINEIPFVMCGQYEGNDVDELNKYFLDNGYKVLEL